MARFFIRAGYGFAALSALSGCMTTSIAPNAVDTPAYLVKSASVAGAAPASVSGPIEQALATSLRSVAAQPGSVPVDMTVTVASYHAARVGSGYRASADVSVKLKPVSGGRVLQAASFHEDAAAPDQRRSEAQLADAIATRVQRNADLPVGAPAAGGNPSRADRSTRQAAQAGDDNGTLSVEALEALMRASSAGETVPDGTRTGSVPQTVEVPDAACSGKSLSSCPPSALLSGDFSLRK